ncbi:Por secretion system C-terminal sorting domain-containing protein [Mesonia phycicola]|uniref:Aminopeptidase N n=1 Tax=Mesonia phycicola TaxID=579105 RepID=A0A1M6FPM7_9FLAO|nr:M1 family aminopeptidase [Mesonia phycicola]SHI99630.1 Por secretion system C-terminal sorting domain-containing protein [Mesonia phycicola]
MMKKYCLFIILLSFFIPITAQNHFLQHTEIAKQELASASFRYKNKISANTGNYDVTYQRLEIEVDPSVAYIDGTVTTYFEAKENLTQVIFDFAQGMSVNQVTQNGVSLTYQHVNEELIIDLPQNQATGVLDSLSINYSGNPISTGFGSFEQTTHNGDEIIWTLSEPYGAKAWWPCKQDLVDKIENIDIYITTPAYNNDGEENIAVANGLEQSQIVNGNLKTTHFTHTYPIPAYLVAFAVTNYSVYTETVANNGNPFSIVNYVYPENLTSAQSSTAITVNIMDLFINNFGSYPFENEKYGHAQFGWGGGMEHTTVSFMGNFSRGLIAHELGHQWFGDKVTCGSWQDIWLNEGFASYMAAMVVEDFDGETAFNSYKQSMINTITSSTSGSVYVPAQDTLSVSRVFSSRLSYNKGAMVLHMLRNKLGDADFFQGLQNYLNDTDLAYSYAKTTDLKTHLENQSTINLDEFFNDWIYGEGYPSFNLTWSQDNTTNDLLVTVAQSQSHSSVSFFEVYLPVRLIGTNGEELDVILNNTNNNQQFNLSSVLFTVQEVQIDPDFEIISKNNNSYLETENFSKNSFTVYPNPTSGNVEVFSNLPISKLTVYNLLGEVIKVVENTKSLSISTFPSGTYFVKIESENISEVRRIIKK